MIDLDRVAPRLRGMDLAVALLVRPRRPLRMLPAPTAKPLPDRASDPAPMEAPDQRSLRLAQDEMLACWGIDPADYREHVRHTRVERHIARARDMLDESEQIVRGIDMFLNFRRSNRGSGK